MIGDEGMPPDQDEPQGECTLPPDHPLTSEVLGRYTLNHDVHEEAEVTSYVNIECNGEESVQHVELIKTEYVTGQRYDVWDVHTDKQRWWVVSDPMNLYAQKHFPSLDYTLSFHVGLMLRVQSRDSRVPTPFDEIYRRRDEVADFVVKAVEAEEFQAAGMRLRECLIALVDEMRRRVTIPANDDKPKGSDVTAWNELLINTIAPGESNKTLRQYLKSTADRTWQLVNWLTHDRDANKTVAIIAHEAVSVLIGHFVGMTIRDKVDITETCPQCSSRAVRSYFDPRIASDGEYYKRCKACDWDDHPDRESNKLIA